jgi:RNase P subunit RPR2
MTPHDKGWLKEYLDFRKELFLDLTLEPEKKSSHPEHSLYKLIQPTGLMYGQSITAIQPFDQDDWTDKDRMKVLLAESLINSALLFQEKPIKTVDELSGIIIKTLDSIANFYNNIFPELSTPSKSFFGKRKTALELAEKILDKRINHTIPNGGPFWTTFFHNSLLFLDVFIYGQWIHTNADKIVADFFRYEREELRFSLVKVIAAAAHANKVVESEEKKLFEYFLQTTELSNDKKKEAMKIFAEGIAIDDINLPSENSWILKKFFIEIAILTIWADKRVEEAEINFLKQFCKYFDFSEEELESSMVAIEGFILEHWKELDHLQDKKNFDNVSEEYIERISKLAEKNKTKLVRELKSKEEIHELLIKASNSQLSEDDKELVRIQLIHLLKTIPTFSITSLPQKFLTLPILLKILPKNIVAEVST